MNGRHVSTDQVAARDAFAFWQDVICDTFINLDCRAPNPSGFSGAVYTQSFGNLQLSAMASHEIGLERTRLRIAQARDEYCLIVVQGRGQTRAEQDGRSFLLEAGDLALFDSARPYRAELRSGFHHFVLKIPREMVRQRLGRAEAVTARRISGSTGIGRIASAFIRDLPAGLNTLDEISAERVSATCVDLVAAALRTVADTDAKAESSTRLLHLVRAKTFIAENIQREELSREMVARALGISPRYLSSLFADEHASVTRFIWLSRIERCKGVLSDRSQRHRSISDIAFASGFNDMSHFSRLFREQVGMTPRQYRFEYGTCSPAASEADAGRRDPRLQPPDMAIAALLNPS
jgi:AraC-like DNA-binding protein